LPHLGERLLIPLALLVRHVPARREPAAHAEADVPRLASHRTEHVSQARGHASIGVHAEGNREMTASGACHSTAAAAAAPLTRLLVARLALLAIVATIADAVAARPPPAAEAPHTLRGNTREGDVARMVISVQCRVEGVAHDLGDVVERHLRQWWESSVEGRVTRWQELPGWKRRGGGWEERRGI